MCLDDLESFPQTSCGSRVPLQESSSECRGTLVNLGSTPRSRYCDLQEPQSKTTQPITAGLNAQELPQHLVAQQNDKQDERASKAANESKTLLQASQHFSLSSSADVLACDYREGSRPCI